MKKKWIIIPVFLTILALMLCSCSGVGPASVARDRFDYTVAISDSWKSQMLLNIVKVRYADTPIFLDVASVINQYSVEQEIGLGASMEIYRSVDSNFISPNIKATGRYTDRPTITYSPITGEKFAKSLMTPLPPSTVFHLVQSGYPVDLVFRLGIQSINGIQNRYGGPSRAQQADPEFYFVLEKMRMLQKANGIGMRIRKINDKETVVAIIQDKTQPKIKELNLEIRRLLNLDPEANEFEVVYDSMSKSGKEIAILTRSMLEILIDISSFIEVPASHVAAKRVSPSFKDETVEQQTVQPLIQIHSSPEKPNDAFVSVRYRDHWFFIHDTDLSSKGFFTFLMFAFALTETGVGKQGVPIVTIPAN